VSKTKPCPTCAKAILPLASICLHCGSQLSSKIQFNSNDTKSLSLTQELLEEYLAKVLETLSPEKISIVQLRFKLTDGIQRSYLETATK